MSGQPCSLRGVFRRRSVDGARRGVLRRRLATKAPGGPGPRPPGTTTWPRGARSTDPEAMPEPRSAAPGQKSPRWSAERRASSRWRARGASQAPGVPRHEHAGAPRWAPRVSRRSATPRRVAKGRFKPRAQCVAGTRKCASSEWRVANRGSGVFDSLLATRYSPGCLTS